MKIFKCDRCKKEIECPDLFIKTTKDCLTEKSIELCPSCSKKFNKWLNEESYHCVYNKECTYRVKEL